MPVRARSPSVVTGSTDSLSTSAAGLTVAAAAGSIAASSSRWSSFASSVLRVDRFLSTALHTRSFFPFDVLLVPFAMVCGMYSVPILIPLIAFFESERLAVVLLMSVLLTVLLTTIGKRVTRRHRPCPTTLGRKFFNIRALESNFSFPSGDSAQGSVLACNLYFYARAYAGTKEPDVPALYILGLIPSIMTARVYFGAHWWSDTLMGVLIGWIATVTSWTAAEYLFGWQFGVDDYRTNRLMTHFGFITREA